MPVTAKLSRAFYEKLGDDVANELVNWFNAVDLTYRTELRELNDLNFARFDAKVGERLAQLRTELQAELRAYLHAEMDARFGKVEERFAKTDERLDKIEDRLTRISDQIGDAKASLIKWTFVFWAGTGSLVLGWLITAKLSGG